MITTYNLFSTLISVKKKLLDQIIEQNNKHAINKLHHIYGPLHNHWTLCIPRNQL